MDDSCGTLAASALPFVKNFLTWKEKERVECLFRLSDFKQWSFGHTVSLQELAAQCARLKARDIPVYSESFYEQRKHEAGRRGDQQSDDYEGPSCGERTAKSSKEADEAVSSMANGNYVVEEKDLYLNLPAKHVRMKTARWSSAKTFDGVVCARILRDTLIGCKAVFNLESIHLLLSPPLSGFREFAEAFHELTKTHENSLQTLSVILKPSRDPFALFDARPPRGPRTRSYADRRDDATCATEDTRAWSESFVTDTTHMSTRHSLHQAQRSASRTERSEEERADMYRLRFDDIHFTKLRELTLHSFFIWDPVSAKADCLESFCAKALSLDIALQLIRECADDSANKKLLRASYLQKSHMQQISNVLDSAALTLEDFKLSGDLSTRREHTIFHPLRFLPALFSLSLDWTCVEELMHLQQSLFASPRVQTHQTLAYAIRAPHPLSADAEYQARSTAHAPAVNVATAAGLGANQSTPFGSYNVNNLRAMARCIEATKQEEATGRSTLPAAGGFVRTLPRLQRLSFSGPLSIGLSNLHLDLYSEVNRNTGRGVHFQYGLMTATLRKVIEFRRRFAAAPIHIMFKALNTRLYHFYTKSIINFSATRRIIGRQKSSYEANHAMNCDAPVEKGVSRLKAQWTARNLSNPPFSSEEASCGIVQVGHCELCGSASFQEPTASSDGASGQNAGDGRKCRLERDDQDLANMNSMSNPLVRRAHDTPLAPSDDTLNDCPTPGQRARSERTAATPIVRSAPAPSLASKTRKSRDYSESQLTRKSSGISLADWSRLLEYRHVRPETSTRARFRKWERNLGPRIARFGGFRAGSVRNPNISRLSPFDPFMVVPSTQRQSRWQSDMMNNVWRDQMEDGEISPPEVGATMSARDLFALEFWQISVLCPDDVPETFTAYDIWDNRLSEEDRQIWHDILPLYICYRLNHTEQYKEQQPGVSTNDDTVSGEVGALVPDPTFSLARQRLRNSDGSTKFTFSKLPSSSCTASSFIASGFTAYSSPPEADLNRCPEALTSFAAARPWWTLQASTLPSSGLKPIKPSTCYGGKFKEI